MVELSQDKNCNLTPIQLNLTFLRLNIGLGHFTYQRERFFQFPSIVIRYLWLSSTEPLRKLKFCSDFPNNFLILNFQSVRLSLAYPSPLTTREIYRPRTRHYLRSFSSGKLLCSQALLSFTFRAILLQYRSLGFSLSLICHEHEISFFLSLHHSAPPQHSSRALNNRTYTQQIRAKANRSFCQCLVQNQMWLLFLPLVASKIVLRVRDAGAWWRKGLARFS